MKDISVYGYHVRNPTMDDVSIVTALVNTCEIAEMGEPDTGEADMRAEWQSAGFDLHADAWVVIGPTGELVGFAKVKQDEHGQLRADAYTHPAHYGRGIATHLLDLLEERARQRAQTVPEGKRVVLRNSIVGTNESARSLLQQRGYELVRHIFGMAIVMEQPPGPVEVPEGITIRPFVVGQDEQAAYEASEESFQDHWGSSRHSFDAWAEEYLQREDVDPSLYFLACEGDEVVGVSLCKNFFVMGLVDKLGVRRPWRRKGIAMALLRHSFVQFYQRGRQKVVLGVDAQSLTGALRLYEQAGMFVEFRFERHEKELRAGKDPRVLSLAE